MTPSMACQVVCLPSPLVIPTPLTLMPGRRRVRRIRHESSACAAVGSVRCPEASPPRRSANYQPTLWPDSFIQTLTSDYTGEAHMAKLEELKRQVRRSFGDVAAAGAAAKLELLDVLRRLGVAYHFEREIEVVLHAMSTNLEDVRRELDGDLLHTALLFRVLREQGIAVPEDVFNNFKDEKGSFKSSLQVDVEGVLSLYEASFLAFVEGDEVLDEARAFATDCLNEFLLGGDTKPTMLRERVEYALEMSLHWRMPRLYTRWFIDVCESQGKMSPVLLEFAKLDFNVVQSEHRRDVRAMSKWWEDVGLRRLSFARDRIMECFFWTVGVIFEPQFGHCRRGLTQVNALITSIDDVYDVYGSIDELESFTEAVERWDIDTVEELPDYMKACFQALFNTTDELANQCVRRNGFNCLSYLRKSWADLCKAYLVEARWYHNKHIPTLGEYMENAWISISGNVILTHSYFLLSETITRENLDTLENYGDLIRCSSTILRLCDDLETSTDEIERGDVPKSIQCDMHERNVSEAVAREHTKALISETWMKMNNEHSCGKQFPTSFVKAAMNLARMAQCIYQYGDGFGIPSKETKSLINSILTKPICL